MKPERRYFPRREQRRGAAYRGAEGEERVRKTRAPRAAHGGTPQRPLSSPMLARRLSAQRRRGKMSSFDTPGTPDIDCDAVYHICRPPPAHAARPSFTIARARLPPLFERQKLLRRMHDAATCAVS